MYNQCSDVTSLSIIKLNNQDNHECGNSTLTFTKQRHVSQFPTSGLILKSNEFRIFFFIILILQNNRIIQKYKKTRLSQLIKIMHKHKYNYVHQFLVYVPKIINIPGTQNQANYQFAYPEASTHENFLLNFQNVSTDLMNSLTKKTSLETMLNGQRHKKNYLFIHRISPIFKYLNSRFFQLI